jgi:hypothetical protein
LQVAPQLQSVEPYQAQLAALSKVPPQVFRYLHPHQFPGTPSITPSSEFSDWNGINVVILSPVESFGDNTT